MKKLLLLIPAVLLAGTGIFWATFTSNVIQPHPAQPTEKMPQDIQGLFSNSEHSLRQIIRHGDTQSIAPMRGSFAAMETKLAQHRKDGYPTAKVEKILSQYEEDTTLLSQKFSPRLKQLQQYDQFESSHEKLFILAVDQIGLYELITAYKNLDRMRNRYLKEPSTETKIAYLSENRHLQNIIKELYLDTVIEKPLFEYLNNHKHYFELISASYEEIGYERILRMRTSAYAIKSELQLLPSS
ncbi:hypothetical protein [Sulfuricurvum sp.]|uniref:hypothetical protein n=1 Tax=Sulfuricurvum sp. TaxID=2025608 RepID=UPI003BB1281C